MRPLVVFLALCACIAHAEPRIGWEYEMACGLTQAAQQQNSPQIDADYLSKAELYSIDVGDDRNALRLVGDDNHKLEFTTAPFSEVRKLVGLVGLAKAIFDNIKASNVAAAMKRPYSGSPGVWGSVTIRPTFRETGGRYPGHGPRLKPAMATMTCHRGRGAQVSLGVSPFAFSTTFLDHHHAGFGVVNLLNSLPAADQARIRGLTGYDGYCQATRAADKVYLSRLELAYNLEVSAFRAPLAGGMLVYKNAHPFYLRFSPDDRRINDCLFIRKHDFSTIIPVERWTPTAPHGSPLILVFEVRGTTALSPIYAELQRIFQGDDGLGGYWSDTPTAGLQDFVTFFTNLKAFQDNSYTLDDGHTH